MTEYGIKTTIGDMPMGFHYVKANSEAEAIEKLKALPEGRDMQEFADNYNDSLTFKIVSAR